MPNQKLVGIVGAGRMGEATAYALKELGHGVVLFDADKDRAVDVAEKYGVWKGADLLDWKLDAIVSCATYTANKEIAEMATSNQVPYFDLGGHVQTSKDIHQMAKDRRSYVFTDLGLAPGLVGIVTEYLLHDMWKLGHRDIDNVLMCVGGLPFRKDFQYACTWSAEGLVNEYLDDSEILEHGKIRKVSSLTAGDAEYINTRAGYSLEARRTSGGVGMMLESLQKRGIKNAEYKTLRYEGHYEFLEHLIDRCKAANNYKIKEFQAALADILTKLYPPAPDKVYVYTALRLGGNKFEYDYYREIHTDGQFTAMQRATAFPLAAVVDNFLGDRITFKGNFGSDYVFDYGCVNWDCFHRSVKKLGIEL